MVFFFFLIKAMFIIIASKIINYCVKKTFCLCQEIKKSKAIGNYFSTLAKQIQWFNFYCFYTNVLPQVICIFIYITGDASDDLNGETWKQSNKWVMNGHDWVDGGMIWERTAAGMRSDVTGVPALAAILWLTEAVYGHVAMFTSSF